MSQIIEIPANQLVVGEIYQDTIGTDEFPPILLKFVKENENSYKFEKVSEGEDDVYELDGEGLIGFFAGSMPFYKKID